MSSIGPNHPSATARTGRIRAPTASDESEQLDSEHWQPAMEMDPQAPQAPTNPSSSQPPPSQDPVSPDVPPTDHNNDPILEQAFMSLLRTVSELQREAAESRTAFASTLARLEQLSSRSPHHASSDSPMAASGSIKFRDPRIFKGKPTELETFMEEMDIAMRLQSRLRNGDDEDRIDYFMMYLGEQGPRKWFSALLKKNPHLRQDWESARSAFMTRYEDPDLKTNYLVKLEALTQSGSFMDYANKFEEYLPFSNWGEEYAMQRFYQGLELELAKRLAGTKRPETVAEWIPIIHEIDKDLRTMTKAHERRSKSHHKHGASSSKNIGTTTTPKSQQAQNVPYVAPRPTNNDVVPMEVDAIKHSKVTPEERERRKREGLCFYCGQGKHRMSECPNMSAERKAEIKARLAARTTQGKA